MANSMQTALQMLQVTLEQNWIEKSREELTKEQKKLYSSIISIYVFTSILNLHGFLIEDLKKNINEWSELEDLEEIMSIIIKKD